MGVCEGIVRTDAEEDVIVTLGLYPQSKPLIMNIPKFRLMKLSGTSSQKKDRSTFSAKMILVCCLGDSLFLWLCFEWPFSNKIGYAKQGLVMQKHNKKL